ncbi:MAG TPA: lysozyme inhibitor LprI family protein, partial [Devosia sp.]|nr:lysozyme inhibitor LprI family protein [Devosia sp.]
MMRTLLGAMLVMLTLASVVPAHAASFDCAKASTAFEHAICDNPKLSDADDTLAIAFATAVGGLSKSAVNAMRAEQRDWLDFAAKSCTDDAQLLPDAARYDDEQIDCLNLALTARMGGLEQSRMLGGHRFAV